MSCFIFFLINYKIIHALKFPQYLHYNKNKNIKQQIIITKYKTKILIKYFCDDFEYYDVKYLYNLYIHQIWKNYLNYNTLPLICYV